MTDPTPLPSPAEDVGAHITHELRNLYDGAEQDLQAYGVAIATDLIEAAATGRTDLIAALQDQARVLAEAHRLRINAAGLRLLDRMIDIAVRVGSAAVGRLGGGA